MATKSPVNSGKPWTKEDERRLRELAKKTPTGLIAHDLKRTEEAVRSKASDLGISLKPTNQSPYGPRKKKSGK